MRFLFEGCAELWCMFRSSPEKLREYRGRFLESFVFGQPFQVDEGWALRHQSHKY
jgi:hypothetical protein